MESNDEKMEDWERPSKEKSFRGHPRKNQVSYLTVIALVVIVLVAAGLIWAIKGENAGSVSNGGGLLDKAVGGPVQDGLKIDQGKYQAVFLSNGQVYFGKINSANGSYLELTNIYYIQVVPVLQQGQEGDNGNKNDNQQQQQEISLVKLGGELHGPLDRMMINKDQVVFVEDLKDDSKVAQAIKQYLDKQK